MPLDNETAAADESSGSSSTTGGEARTTEERNRGAFNDNYTGNSPKLPKVKKPNMYEFLKTGSGW